ncbi:MDR family MFS transporter [Anoxybacteroides tepidamans]|uniref:MDR family MFS transporter n=1 Tax=Anoxybacteroides tepidamans TaxID=265948 RepID=UPI0004844812|nr:MFS transporter [Anoxybacillus tepidamans]
MGFFLMHRNIQIRIITSFLTRIVGSMVFPFMAIYFAQKLGETLAGILLFINAIVSLITGLYGGYIADRIGRKKVLLFGQGMLVISFAVMALANSKWFDSAWVTFCMMTLNSVGNGLTNPAAEAMLIDVSTPENRKMMYSINYWATNLSIAIGSIMGGMLFKTHRFELFVALTVVAILTFFLMLFFMVEVFQTKQMAEKRNVLLDIVDNYKKIMHDKAFILFSLATLCVMSIEFQLSNYIGIRLERKFQPITVPLFGFPPVHIDGLRMLSFISTENTILVVCLAMLIAKWIKGFSETKVLYTGIFIYAIGYTLLGFSNHIAVLLVACFIYTMGELTYVPVKQSTLASIINADARSSYMAINGFVFQIARITGSLGVIIGSLIGSYGMSFLFFVLGMLSIVLFRSSLSIYKQTHMARERIS